MKHFYPCLVSFLCLLPFTGYAQQTGTPGRCPVTISAKNVAAWVNEDGGTDEFTWRALVNNVGQCIQVDGEAAEFTVNQALLNTTVDIHYSLPIYMEAWEDDSGSRCIYTTSSGDPDDAHCETSGSFSLYDFAPGISNTLTLNCDTRYWVVYEFKYTPPVPEDPVILRNGSTYSSGLVCDDEIITLTTDCLVQPQFRSGVTLTWFYRIVSEDYEAEVPNPAYCGNDPFSCNGGGPQPQVQSVLMVPSFSALSFAPAPTTDPPCCFEPPTITQTQQLWRSLPSTDGNTNRLECVIYLE